MRSGYNLLSQNCSQHRFLNQSGTHVIGPTAVTQRSGSGETDDMKMYYKITGSLKT